MFEMINDLFNTDMIANIEYLVRIIVAGICGIVIGYERKTRRKGAGIRTHMIVALASSLMMVVSKYGFADMDAIMGLRGADGSRIASQIVTGVGFLGAGMIYVHKNSISGLTTAAGIWATSGIGMAIGSGMYFIGIASTAAMFISQIILHKDLKIMKMAQDLTIKVTVEETEEGTEYLDSLFANENWQVEKFKSSRNDGLVELTLDVIIPPGYTPKDFFDIVENRSFVRSFSIS